MRKVIYSYMVSLDGFIETPERSLDWIIIDEELHRYINDKQSTIGAYLNGRRMYELMAGFWPTADADPTYPDYIAEYARIWKQMPKIVFSKTLEQVGENARLVRDDLAGEVARLKAQPGKDLDLSGANLAASLMRLGLVDEYQLFVQPVILGSGTRMFPALEEPARLRLVETHTFGSGVVMLHYQRGEGKQESHQEERRL